MARKDFTIDMDIYSQESIEEAIEDYKDVCSISYNNPGKVTFESEEDIDVFFNEFTNYVISL